MTGVETIGRIRFEHYQNGKGIKRIARELGIARDTVRKVLLSGATEFSYKRTGQFAKVLGLVPDHGIGAVEQACAEALEAGIASGDVIVAIMARRHQPPIP